MKVFKEAHLAGLKFRAVAASTAPLASLRTRGENAWADTVQAGVESGLIRLDGRENRRLRRAYNRLREAEKALQIEFYDAVAN